VKANVCAMGKFDGTFVPGTLGISSYAALCVIANVSVFGNIYWMLLGMQSME
jgi:hypothetical protein